MLRFLAALVALLSMPLAAQAPRPAHPALWKVTRGASTIYLFGTAHLLPPGIDWFEGPVRQAFDGADTLVTEIILPDPAALRGELMQLARAPAGPTLRERLPATSRARLEQALAGFGLPAATFDAERPWFASLMLAELEYKKLGFDPADGAEFQLEAAAKAAAKPQIGLEDAVQQLRFFSSPSDADQLAYLQVDLRDLSDAERDTEEIVADWTGGRPERLAGLINKELDQEPKLKAVMFDRRNARWADWIAERLKHPGTVFIAVGAGHVSGAAGSVQALLAKRGIKAVRVQ